MSDEQPLSEASPYSDHDSHSEDSDFELDELRADLDTAPLTGKHSTTKASIDVTGLPRKVPWWQSSRALAIALLSVTTLFLLVGIGWRKYREDPRDGQSPPWYPTPVGGQSTNWHESYKKASRMVEKMTLAEKVNITTGTGWRMGLAVGNTGPATHVGFPALALQDGPLGIRFADNATAFPAGVTVGATWDRELMYARGSAHGEEARRKGINVLLGPSVGPLGRAPAGGRNWEGFGADPYLQGVAGAVTVKGIQDQGVMATIKHYIGNEQEHFRQAWAWGIPHAISSNIDDRTMHEVYAWPFLDAIKAGVASVMCSYNMVNNSYACGNSKMLNGILKDEMGFEGFVMSDWLAQRSGIASALAGLDMSMPGDGLGWEDGIPLWGPHLSRGVLNGSLPLLRLDDMVTRIVAAWYQLGQDDKTKFDGKGPNFSSWTFDKMGTISPGSPTPQESVVVNQYVDVQSNHSILARQIAAEGSVLLKNDGTLPLRRDGTPGSQKQPPDSVQVRLGIFGEDSGPGMGPNYCEDRGCNQGTLGSGWGSGAVEFPYLVPPVQSVKNTLSKDVEVTEWLKNDIPKKLDLSGLDTCLVFVNSDAGEGYLRWESVNGDRNDLNLQKGGDALIEYVAKNCGGGKGRTIVVIHAVGPVVVEKWIDMAEVKAVIAANLPGQESGNAITSIIFGDVNPSGKLPYTVGRTLSSYGKGGQVLYRPNAVVPQQNFDEGLYIDYRHFDKYNIEPRFAFGFGLSYTTFEFSNLQIHEQKSKSPLPAPRPGAMSTPPSYSHEIPDVKEVLFPANIRKLAKFIYPYLDSESDFERGDYPYPEGFNEEQPPSQAGGAEGGNPDLWVEHVHVEVDVKNTGKVGGKFVAQLYLSFPETQGVDFPVRVLRGFEKKYLNEGESATITFGLTRRDLSYWDTAKQNWRMPGGKFTIAVGESSRDLPISGTW